MTASDELRLGGDHNRQINYRRKNNNNKTKQKKDNLWDRYWTHTEDKAEHHG